MFILYVHFIEKKKKNSKCPHQLFISELSSKITSENIQLQGQITNEINKYHWILAFFFSFPYQSVSAVCVWQRNGSFYASQFCLPEYKNIHGGTRACIVVITETKIRTRLLSREDSLCFYRVQVLELKEGL